MAEAAREEYRDVHFDVCFCSPLIRARETADILLQGRNIPVITDDRLMEMSFGSFEGIENSFQIPDCPVNELFFHPDQYIAPPGGGENLDDLFARTGAFLEERVNPLLKEGKDCTDRRPRCNEFQHRLSGSRAVPRPVLECRH